MRGIGLADVKSGVYILIINRKATVASGKIVVRQ
jgi:hypothetical protein